VLPAEPLRVEATQRGMRVSGDRRWTRSSGEMVLRCGGRPVIAAAWLYRQVRARSRSRGSRSRGIDSGLA
jgi:hypothetical protein